MRVAVSIGSNPDKRQSARTLRAQHVLALVLMVALALTAVRSAPADAAREWVGLGSINEVTPDPNWSDELNFTNVSSPTFGLIFPGFKGACVKTISCYESHNNAGDPDISAIQFDDAHPYHVTGEGILLDKGFQAEPDAEAIASFEASPDDSEGTDCSEWAIPLALTAAQTWNFKGPFCGVDFRESIVDGDPTDHFPLTIDVGDPSETGEDAGPDVGGISLEGTVAGGNITVNGENRPHEPSYNGRFSFGVPFSTEAPGSLDFPGTAIPGYESQGTSLTLNAIQWEGAGNSTSIKSVDSNGSIGNAFGATSQSLAGIFLTSAGQLQVHGDVDFEAGPTANFENPELNDLDFSVLSATSQPKPGSDYSQLSATGAVHLDSKVELGNYDAQVGYGSAIFTDIQIDKTFNGACQPLVPGTVYTLIHADGGITGTFANAPQGALVPVYAACAGGDPDIAQRVKLEYSADELTATVLNAPDVETDEQAENDLPTATGAVLGALINPHNVPTSLAFSYGPYSEVTGEEAFEELFELHQKTAAIPLSSSAEGSQVLTHVLGSLTPGTDYLYYADALFGSGEVLAADNEQRFGSFDTAAAPVATTGSAEVGATSVTLNGTIDPEGSGKPVDYMFRYGTSPGALSAQVPTAAALSGTTGEEYHVENPETAVIALTSLNAGATYHYEIVAEYVDYDGSLHEFAGAEETFTAVAGGGSSHLPFSPPTESLPPPSAGSVPPTVIQPSPTAKGAGVTASAPKTKILKLKVAGKKAIVTFAGTGGVGKLTFLCRLSKALSPKPCKSPETYSKLKPGKYTLRVQARDAGGILDPKGASVSFKIKS